MLMKIDRNYVLNLFVLCFVLIVSVSRRKHNKTMAQASPYSLGLSHWSDLVQFQCPTILLQILMITFWDFSNFIEICILAWILYTWLLFHQVQWFPGVAMQHILLIMFYRSNKQDMWTESCPPRPPPPQNRLYDTQTRTIIYFIYCILMNISECESQTNEQQHRNPGYMNLQNRWISIRLSSPIGYVLNNWTNLVLGAWEQ